MQENSTTKYWDHAAKQFPDGQYYDKLLAEQYRYTHLDLISRWSNLDNNMVILKTDLFAEALCPPRAFIWNMPDADYKIIGIDISSEITARAKENTPQSNRYSCEYTSCDIRKLPFRDNSFDLVISDSTLDHFEHKEHITASLSELKRILKAGGTLIITMDNKQNITEPLFRLWLRLGIHPFFIGKTYSMKELINALVTLGYQVIDSTALLHNPRYFTRAGIALFRRIPGINHDDWITRCLTWFDGFEYKKIRLLTAQFIAVKAVKPVE
jgi:SAM-dependent methyltransferase